MSELETQTPAQQQTQAPANYKKAYRAWIQTLIHETRKQWIRADTLGEQTERLFK